MIERHLTSIALIAMAAWVPLCGLLFVVLARRTAVLAAFLTGYLLLPQGSLEVPGVLPDVDRNVVVHCTVLLCIAAFDTARLAALRPRWIDLPMAMWVLAAVLSSVSNDLGIYDGLSCGMQRGIMYGLPYAIGRMYFADAVGLRHLALAIVLGALLYAPLCLYEVRMSPQLHSMVYGYHAHSFHQTHRLGGWRPTVFLQHGLAVGLWMSTASMLGVWLLLSGAIRRQDRVVAGTLVVALLATTFICKSLGSMVLLSLGLAGLVLARTLGRAWPILLLTAAPPAYVTARVTESWTGDGVVAIVAEHVSRDRAQSLSFRLGNETLLTRKALEQPALGWSGYGRATVMDERDKHLVVDGLWVNALGQNGLFGLTALGAVLLLPIVLFVSKRGDFALRHEPEALGLATLVALAAIDGLMNAMFNPFAILALAGLGALAVAKQRREPHAERIVGYLPGQVAFA